MQISALLKPCGGSSFFFLLWMLILPEVEAQNCVWDSTRWQVDSALLYHVSLLSGCWDLMIVTETPIAHDGRLREWEKLCKLGSILRNKGTSRDKLVITFGQQIFRLKNTFVRYSLVLGRGQVAGWILLLRRGWADLTEKRPNFNFQRRGWDENKF